jgi:hypothetical protein
MTTDATIPPPILENFPPNFVLGKDYTPHPSDWSRFPTQSGQRLYWFFGQRRDPATTVWQPDALVGHSYDIYENVTLSTVQYDDTGGDRDSMTGFWKLPLSEDAPGRIYRMLQRRPPSTGPLKKRAYPGCGLFWANAANERECWPQLNRRNSPTNLADVRHLEC